MDNESRFPIRRFKSFDAMKAEEYAYWQARPAHERMNAVAELTAATYRHKDGSADASRLLRVIQRLKR